MGNASPQEKTGGNAIKGKGSTYCTPSESAAWGVKVILAPAKLPHSRTFPLLIRYTTVATTSVSFSVSVITVCTRSKRVELGGSDFIAYSPAFSSQAISVPSFLLVAFFSLVFATKTVPLKNPLLFRELLIAEGQPCRRKTPQKAPDKLSKTAQMIQSRRSRQGGDKFCHHPKRNKEAPWRTIPSYWNIKTE
jgi:hypothetical protein